MKTVKLEVFDVLPICLPNGYMLGYQNMTIFLGPVVPQVAERASSHRSGTRRMLRRILGRSKWKEAKRKGLGDPVEANVIRNKSGINQGHGYLIIKHVFLGVMWTILKWRWQ